MFGRRRKSQTDGSIEQQHARRIAELTASRRAIADAYEVERRRIERDLHDGTQQYLVAAAMKLGEAQLDAADLDSPELVELLAAAKHDLDIGLASLRQTVRGIHPQVLADQGLVAAIEQVAAGLGPQVIVRAPNPLPHLSESVLAAAYFFATEAMTNAVKHAPGSNVTVLVITDERLSISVMDDGPGGAHLVPGHGLAGMRERLAAFDATLEVHSPAGGPTQVAARIPLLLDRGQPGVGAAPQRPDDAPVPQS